MRAFDPALSSPFRIEWLVPLEPGEEDDFGRAVAEKAEPVLRAARFLAEQANAQGVDLEIRVWVQAARASACLSITWEPGAQAFGFHLLDESLRERLAVVVFEDLPCVDAEESLGQADHVLEAALASLVEARGSVRVPVVERAVDSGVEP